MTGLPLPGDSALVVQHIVIGEISPIISWLSICRFRHLRLGQLAHRRVMQMPKILRITNVDVVFTAIGQLEADKVGELSALRIHNSFNSTTKIDRHGTRIL
ncbi:hypothetical protein P3T23_006026 [Paraburkholderia sp. GAS448]